MKGKKKPEAMEETQVNEGGFGEEKKERYVDVNEKNPEEVDEEEEGDYEDEEEGNGEGEMGVEERPKLDEGFYEIEAIRRKRVRKGQVQYLIKWQGWPEAANTWEPIENLQSISDVIDAFEESLRSGSGKSSRRRKRKHIKKKQSNSSVDFSLSGVEVNVEEKPLDSASVGNTGHVDSSLAIQHVGPALEVQNNSEVVNGKEAKQGIGDGLKNISNGKEDNEYDPKLIELRGAVSIYDGEKIAVQFQEGKDSEVNNPTNGLLQIEYEPLMDARRTGSKRRKSGSVKRFKKDTASSEDPLGQNSMVDTANEIGGTAAAVRVDGTGGTNLNDRPIGEDSVNPSIITKIIKPISFSASVYDNNQDVLVTFLAVRADGQEVTVNNRFLKATNPLLLINFYEQNLRYGT